VQHMQAVPHREVAAVIRKVRASNALPAAGLALEFLVLPTARWGEVRWAEEKRRGCPKSGPLKWPSP